MPTAPTIERTRGVLAPSQAPARPRARRLERAHVAAALGGAAIAGAWLVPGTAASAALGWLAAGLMVVVFRAPRPYLAAYLAGVVGHAVGFHWVFSTVANFGGLGTVLSAAVFGLFVATGALQFLLMAVIYARLGPRLDALALRAPAAVVLAELVMPRLFRWHWGHTQIAFTPLAQAAALGGTMLVSFAVFWAAEAAVRAVVLRDRRRALLLPAAALAGLVGYGVWAARAFDAAPPGVALEVVLVQGNAPMNETRDPDLAWRNLSRLHELTRRAPRGGALVVWPEGSIPLYVPAGVRAAGEEPALPWYGDGSAFLVGAYAFDTEGRRYNAAFAVGPDGRVPPPYFKRVLIPFGEAMPFADVLPWLNRLNARAGAFTPGTEAGVFPVPTGTGRVAKVAPLICYEDTVPSLARQAVRRGAGLLVNLTYDTWFGRSVAPAQHHLIASFRAIENGRYLVRATNSGLSAVVDPLGRTVARVEPFTEGAASTRVRLIARQTPYTRSVGEAPWWGLLGVCALGAAARRAGARKQGLVF